jgi:diguanylate cyclase
MTAHDPQFHREARGLLGWLGFRSREADELPQPDDTAAAAEEAGGIHDPRERRRRQVLDDVSRFLVTHRLEVSNFTLSIAYDVITGGDLKLAQKIEERVSSRQPVTLEWLERTSRNSGRDDGTAALQALMGRLESTIDEFARATTAARTATHDYSSALETHVDELEQVSKAGAVISELASIARIMLDRTREIEQEMSRSEMQTRSLQKNLDEARRSAETDHLTGLPNRRAFEQRFESELAAAEEAGEPVCIAFCDIDHFKRVNDTHGHDAGDRVLRAVASALAKISDDRCHVARHGGEEFVILFRGKSLDEAAAALDAARVAMSERRMVNRATDVPFGRITFSAGIADLADHPDPRTALRAADDALYAAKAQGRNCIAKAGVQPVTDTA